GRRGARAPRPPGAGTGLGSQSQTPGDRTAVPRPYRGAMGRRGRAPEGVRRREKGRRAMTKHKTGTREQWLAARLELLDAAQGLTRRSDELARRRQALPWVRIDKQYKFETDEGSASLADLFRGRSQIFIYQFMFGRDYSAVCHTCSAIADGFDGSVVQLANHDVTPAAVFRPP